MKIKKGKSLCFFSAKGGVGKTTNIINLAGVLEQLNKKVLIIDLDLYSGGVATFLNRSFDYSIYNMAEDLRYNHFNNFKDYIISYDEYIDILCAPRDPRDANKVKAEIISDIIKKAELLYDVVLIDTNHTLDEINLTALNTVSNILFVINNDPLDLKNIKSLITIFNNLEMTNYKVLLNNSRDPFKSYFSLYDIKHIIKHNIDYTLSSGMFFKDMEKYIMNGTIVTLENKFSNIMSDDYQTFVVIATDLLEDGDSNE